jgi:crotonobetainyl-CoA:carnitine CoA-transferase CaiB-like acyl-CoA transferase
LKRSETPLGDGIRILDLSRYVPGITCTMMLADFGADVISVESLPSDLPLAEELMRQRTTTFRNKRSISLNLKMESSKEIFYKLAETADVIVEGFRPGVVKRLGVDYETIRNINPRIIYCSITGYGQDGAYKDLPGHDPNYLAITGVLDATGESGRRPAFPLNLVGDMAGGAMSAVCGILLALVAREKTGSGQFVDIAMVDGILSLFSSIAYMYLEFGEMFKRGEHWLTGGVPEINAYEAKDGRYITIACQEPWFWERLCHVLGRDDFITYQFDSSKRGEIFRCFRQIFLTKPRDAWFELLRQAEVPVAPVYSMDETFSDPNTIHRGMITEVDDATKGKVKQIGIGIKLSHTPGKIRHLGPKVGQHTGEVLTELGYKASKIAELQKAGAIYWPNQNEERN